MAAQSQAFGLEDRNFHADMVWARHWESLSSVTLRDKQACRFV
jgi:hypothetical protein